MQTFRLKKKSLVFLLMYIISLLMGFCLSFSVSNWHGAFAALFINFLRSFDVQDNKYRIFCL